jgi:TetR/AcrR family transcriptional regulator
VPNLTPSRQRRKEYRPQELLDAALDLFVERGFAATRSEDVAARAGVSKGTLYLYYPSKQDLLKAVMRCNLIDPITQSAEDIAQFQGSTAALLEQVLFTWWERLGETRASGIFKVLVAEVRNFPDIAQFYFDEMATPSKHLLGEVIQRGVDTGEFRAVNVPAVVNALVGPMVFLVLHRHSIGACSADFLLEPKPILCALIDMAINGLLPRNSADLPSPHPLKGQLSS